MENLAVVTGASSGIGLELASHATQKNYDLIIAAEEPAIETTAEELRGSGANVLAVQADLATREGFDRLYQAIRAGGRPVDALLAKRPPFPWSAGRRNESPCGRVDRTVKNAR